MPGGRHPTREGEPARSHVRCAPHHEENGRVMARTNAPFSQCSLESTHVLTADHTAHALAPVPTPEGSVSVRQQAWASSPHSGASCGGGGGAEAGAMLIDAHCCHTCGDCSQSHRNPARDSRRFGRAGLAVNAQPMRIRRQGRARPMLRQTHPARSRPWADPPAPVAGLPAPSRQSLGSSGCGRNTSSSSSKISPRPVAPTSHLPRPYRGLAVPRPTAAPSPRREPCTGKTRPAGSAFARAARGVSGVGTVCRCPSLAARARRTGWGSASTASLAGRCPLWCGGRRSRTGRCRCRTGPTMCRPQRTGAGG